MAEHTPGPWHAYNRGIGWEVHFGPEPTDGEHWKPRTPTPEDQRAYDPALTCQELNGGFRETMTEGDARLVAAAPEMLRELETILALVNSGALAFRQSIAAETANTGRFRQVKALIAKATGGAS